MGHVMLMPSAWLFSARDRWRARAEVGYGHALASSHDDHQHGAVATAPVVSPMNAKEITGALWTDFLLVPFFAPGLSITAATPIGHGETRAIASLEARLLLGRLEPWFAVQAPFLGDPFGVRVVGAVTFRP
jgi:hypothetical protein